MTRLAVAAIILLALLSIVGAVVSAAASPYRPRLDSRVLDETADGKAAQFLVLMRAKVDAHAIAARAPTRAAQGRMVYSALRQTARSSQAGLQAQLDSMHAKYTSFSVANAMVVQGDRSVLDAVMARSDVLEIEQDDAFTADLERPSTSAPRAADSVEWNVSLVNAPAVWAEGDTGQGMVYANADTGVQWDHPALKPQYQGWDGTNVDHNFTWWDAIHSQIAPTASSCGYNLQAPCDDYPHGTHTMGTAIGDDGAGNQIGIAPGAKWIACRNMDHGVGRPSTYIECMDFFLAPWDLNKQNANPDLRPDAVGNSYGCPFGNPPDGETCVTDSLLDAMDNLRAAGVFMAVSAGNSGSNGTGGCGSVVDPPAIYDSAITIGATDASDAIASFSSRGPSTVDENTYRKPDLVAPGVNVRSSVPTNSYQYDSGTSMSSPHVAGAVLLLWSAFPAFARDVDRTEFLLEQSAKHLYGSEDVCGGDAANSWPNNTYGYGRIDIKAAYDLAAHVPVPSESFFPWIAKNP